MRCSEEVLDEVTFDHISDGERCIFTDPKPVTALRVKAGRFGNWRGFAVDHDLPLNNKRLEFTAQLDFKLTSGE